MQIAYLIQNQLLWIHLDLLRLRRFGAVGRSSFAITFTQIDLLLPLFFHLWLFFCLSVSPLFSCGGDDSVGVHRAPWANPPHDRHNSRSVYTQHARHEVKRLSARWIQFFLGHNYDSVYCKNSKRTIEEIDSETPYSLFLFLSHFFCSIELIGEEGGLQQDGRSLKGVLSPVDRAHECITRLVSLYISPPFITRSTLSSLILCLPFNYYTMPWRLRCRTLFLTLSFVSALQPISLSFRLFCFKSD